MPERPGRGVPLTATCAACGVTSLHRAHTVYLTTSDRVQEAGLCWPEPWDGVYVEPILACPFCQVDDDYAISPEERARLWLHPTSHAGQVLLLPDGSIARRPSEAAALLHARAQRLPKDAVAWRELGDLCFRVGLERAALDHWLHAHRIDPTEVRAGASLAWVAHLFGFDHVSAALAAEVLERHTRTSEALSPDAFERMERIRKGARYRQAGTQAARRRDA